MASRPCAILLSVCVAASAVEAELSSPLSTPVDLIDAFPAGGATLEALVAVPADAPADLGVGAYAVDAAGGWRQSDAGQRLRPGDNRIRLTVPAGAVGDGGAIGGLLFSSAAGSAGRLRIAEVRIVPLAPPAGRRILDLAWDGAGAGTARGVAGAPWRLRLRPEDPAGFRLVGTASGPAGTVQLAGAPDPAGTGWSLPFVPPQPGRWRIEARAGWLDLAPLAALDLDVAAGPDAPPIAPAAAAAGAGRVLRLAAPLRTCLGVPLDDGSAACRIVAQLRVGADAPDDLAVGAFACDRAGRWRQSAGSRPLPPGEHRIELAVPAGEARGPGEAGIVLWSARAGGAAVLVHGLTASPLAGSAAGTPLLDRLRLDGVRQEAASLTVAAGATWSVSVVPAPAEADIPGLGFALSVRLSDGAGRTIEVPGAVAAGGRHRVELHPTIPGAYAATLVGRWSDGRRVECPLPRLTVAGPHPCPDGTAVALRGPLATVLPVPLLHAAEPHRIEATVLVPDGAPADLAVGAAVVDHFDRWHRSGRPQPLRAGVNRLAFAVERDAPLVADPGGAPLRAGSLAILERSALVFTTAATAPCPVVVGGVAARPLPPAPAPSEPRLLDLDVPAVAATGERWTLALRPDPFPANPFDPEAFRCDLQVTTPEGATQLVPGFYAEEMASADRGDRETLRPAAPGGFRVRYRPRTPGVHRLALQAEWGGRRLRCELPPLRVTGAPWDGYLRVDRQDPRFFAVDGRFAWPLGPNLRSVWDVRSRDNMHTRLTADRGSLAYAAYLRRFAAAGADACEIWLSSWNLAMEWREDWPGYAGLGRYNQENAWRLDRILDAAWAAGMRINLVVNNHGQASDSCDAEWANNPWNRAVGGPLATPDQLFHDPRALAGQDRLRRYLVARYADHPAILGWKLWSEIDLTRGREHLPEWHRQAVRRWHELDAYGHPVATHWCGDYTHPRPEIVRLLDYVCIDAYHGDRPQDRYRFIHRLLNDSTLEPARGLARHGRPVLVTEYGGSSRGTRTDALMAVDHAVGAWAAFVSGHAGAPMLWWFEWIDQGGRFAPFTAMRRFVAGEDLRGDGRAAALRSDGPSSLWLAAWRTRDRVFGYAVDEGWSAEGREARSLSVNIVVEDGWPAGPFVCEWWDPDTGAIVATRRGIHPGGTIRLSAPAFRRHLAWKIRP